MKTLTILSLAALLAIAGTSSAHAQSTAGSSESTPSVSNSAESDSTQQPHVKIMWARLLDRPPLKVVHEQASPNHPIPLAQVVKEEGMEEEGPPPKHRRGDFTFTFGNFPYHAYYAWTPPIGNQPIPYGLYYW